MLIKNTVEQEKSLLTVEYLCKLCDVSRSGYYNWINSADKRKEKELNDKEDFVLILKAYEFRGYKKGARSIYMRLLHLNERMNLKKIRRLMNKYGLRCPIRKRNVYKLMLKATKEGYVAKNIVKRDFLGKGLRKTLLTDITYLFYRSETAYLSTIIDAYTREVLAYEVSENLRVDFVLKTLDRLIEEHGCTLDDETIIHSDQGVHYTSLAFIERIKTEGLVQSMSRKGNCWDNAPQESFFGHMKDEIAQEIRKCNGFEEVTAIVDDWMDYYNNDRYQWDLEKLSPKQYYEYCKTGIHPLEEMYGKK